MNTSLATIFLLFYVWNVVGHSAPSCTKKVSNEMCAGFPRYYHFNHLPSPLPSSSGNVSFFASRDRQFQLQAGVDFICPEYPSLPEYTADFPMAKAHPGGNLTLQHPPRGHATQPSSSVWIYIHPSPNIFESTKQPAVTDFVLIGSYPFNNCNQLTQEISWANCTGQVTIPRHLMNGVYTFWWRWSLNNIPYSDCFEVNITRRG